MPTGWLFACGQTVTPPVVGRPKRNKAKAKAARRARKRSR